VLRIYTTRYWAITNCKSNRDYVHHNLNLVCYS